MNAAFKALDAVSGMKSEEQLLGIAVAAIQLSRAVKIDTADLHTWACNVIAEAEASLGDDNKTIGGIADYAREEFAS